MKKNGAVLFFSALILAAVLTACSSVQTVTAGNSSNNTVIVIIDLVNVNNDKVMVTVKPSTINSETITYQLPAIIPGTYAISDYGRFVDDFSAIDNKGNALTVTKRDVNTWVIHNAPQLAQVKYYVNDTYDCEVGDAFLSDNKTIFSPAGTNILADKQFMLNMAGFVGYFENQKNYPYQVNINHPADLIGTTAMNDLDVSNVNDVFNVTRYADLVDSPVMYAAPDTASFTVDDMKVVLHVYSPINKEITANYLLPDLKKMITAQKNFLGNINHTPKYAILVYVTAGGKDDASGIGALEHNTSTTAVFMQTMQSEDLIHVISHEFFHTLTPLNVHSKEIQDFDFNNPKMSAHLWMYEGITEYFANLFQVNQGLISEDEFFNTMSLKEFNAHRMFPANISFTEMSKNVLNPEVKKLYPNVYQKGALLAMCIDIIIRDKSNGERGVLDMMARLSKKYGPDKPFEDSELISEVTNITYPEVGDFIQKYIVNGEPVDYSQTLKLVGLDKINIKRSVEIAFIVDNKPYIKIDTTDHKVLVSALDGQNEFINSIGLQDNDQMLEINGQLLDTSDLISVLGGVYNLKEGTPMVIKVIRNGQEMELRGNAKLNLVESPGYKFVDQSKKDLKDKWLKN
ncbi:MAG: peptidase M61 [Ignavibacteriales bacterium]|nr:MAG: peptidase M61 [Ignavibacteriales bacterium]